MARTIQEIKKDLTAIEEIVANLAVELRELDLNYLNVLSNSTRQQLILATYQICTQVYPDSFLKLSFSQREKLQKNIRKLGNNAQQMFSQCLTESNRQLELKNQQQNSLPSGTETTAETTEENPREPATNITETTEKNQENNEEKVIIFSNPNDLIYWQLLIEQGIHETLNNISKEANRYLLQSGIVPKKLPAKVMEMALQAEEAGTSISGLPNLLDFIIETGINNEEKEAENIIEMTAIRLRLTEIEFADQNLTIERNKVRNLLAKIEQIQKKYQKIKKECAIAEAETAWRSSWFDD